MTDIPADPADAAVQLRVENSLLRAALWTTARRLKDYHDARHTRAGDGQLQLTVPESLRAKTAEALAKAHTMLKDQERGCG